MNDLLKLIRGLELFQDLADKQLEQVAAIAKKVQFPAQHNIFLEHEPAKDVFIIIEGDVSLVICTPRVGCRQLMVVHAGELIGWSPLVGRARLSDTARTLTPTTVIAMNGDKLLTLCAEDPRFGFEFMHRAAQTLASRLSATRLQLLNMCGIQLPEVQLESD
jgi:CRP-like cAMP-binding protein